VLAISANGTGSIDARSATGGIQGGFNWQIGNVLYGLESDFSWFHLSGARAVTANYPVIRPANIYTIGTSFETNSLFTLRGRLGWTASNLLAYATGGLALTNLRVANSFTDNVGALGAMGGASNSDQRTGWTVGGGLEWALNNHWTVRGEYLYVNFGNQRITAATTVTNPSPGFAGYSNALGAPASDLTVQIARGGINYKF
jgi:outer membrane immunogenic protein